MNQISFPGFGLDLTTSPVAFTVFGYELYWYGIIIAAGFLLAVFFCLKQTDEFGLRSEDLLDVLIFATPAALIGARAYYVIFYLELFQKPGGGLDFGKMLRIHDGGMAIYGAIIAALLTTFIVMKKKKIPFLAMADLGAFGLLIGQVVGRFGNFVNVEAYGGETSLPWRMGITVDAQYIEVHPTFLYESLWNLIGFVLLFVLLKLGLRKFDGMIFCSYVVWYGIGRGLIEGLRTDSLYFFASGLRVSQVLGFATAGLALAYMIIRFIRRPQQKDLFRYYAQDAEEPAAVTEEDETPDPAMRPQRTTRKEEQVEEDDEEEAPPKKRRQLFKKRKKSKTEEVDDDGDDS